jgi:hypothetical protein
MEEKLSKVLNGLMNRYKERVPDVKKIINAMISEGLITSQEDIENDHIAFRTLGVPNLGIRSFEKIFLHYGYEKKDAFNFKAKKLNAFWYSPPSYKFPRIFISELRVTDFDQDFQDIIKKYTADITSDPVDSLNLDNPTEVDEFLHKPLWETPLIEDFLALQAKSEYAAWVIYNRYYLNHFTISVHSLPKFNILEDYNKFLENIPVKLNDAGGIIKVSADQKLRQSSTVSGMLNAEFPNSKGEIITHEISGSYVEFAERLVLDKFKDIPKDKIKREHRRDGFEAGNADKIFESTYSDQTSKK